MKGLGLRGLAGGFLFLILFNSFILMGDCFAVLIPQVPDTQQPPAGSIGNPVDNACAPVSAVNVTQYWDVVMHHPNAINVNAGLAAGTAADYIYYFMDTDNWGSLARMNGNPPQYPPAVGTYNIDIAPGFQEFVRWDAANPFLTPPPNRPAGKLGYNWNFATDYVNGYNGHTAAINAGRPDIVSFKYWNPLPSGTWNMDSGDTVYFYTWGPQIQDWPNPLEHWNLNYSGEGIGHAVTGVGFRTNFDPDGAGPLPLTNWIICHDNWPGTARNIALPWANWIATVLGDPGPMPNPPAIVVVPDSIYHSQRINVLATYPNDFTISNMGNGPLVYNAFNRLTWITLGGITGSIPAGGVDPISITVNTASIAAGTYVDTVTIYCNDPQHPILHKPKIVILVRPDSLYWKDFNGPQANGYMPDFDQKQDFNGDGFVDGGYCGPVAVANSFWWFQGEYPNRHIIDPAFYPNNPIPFIQLLAGLMHTNQAGMPPFPVSGTYVDSMESGISQYLQLRQINDLLYEHTIDQPTFEQVEAEIARCQDVTLLIGFWVVRSVQTIGPGQWLVTWARTGGHYVTSAGVNSLDKRIGISDPFYDNFEDHVCDGVLRGIHHIHPAGHNDGISASHDIYPINDTMVCSPGGVWELEHAFWHQPGLQSEFENQNGDTLRIAVTWPCPFPPLVGMLFSEIEAAVIVSPFEGTPDIDILPDSVQYTQAFNLIITYPDQFTICNLGTAPLRIDSIKCDLGFVTWGPVPSPIPAGACDTVDITINTNGLNLGNYTGFFHVYSNDPDEAIVNKPKIKVQVLAPDIAVFPDSIYHSQLAGTNVPYLSDFTIFNNGTNPLLIFGLTNTVPWISFGGVPPGIAPGGNSPIDVFVNTLGIPPGTYVDVVTITSNDPDTPVLNKPKIVIRVTPVLLPNIVVTPDSVYHSQETETLLTYPDDFRIINTGTGHLLYTCSNTIPWITLAGMTGDIWPDGAADSISVTVNTFGVLPGVYLDSVTINSNDPDSPVLHKPKIVIQVTPEPCDYYKLPYTDYAPNGMPDFDQKQDGWMNPQGATWSWCGPVALANCIWWFDSKFEPNPVDPRPFYPNPGHPPNDNYPLLHPFGPWDDHDMNNVVPFISMLGPMCNVDVPSPGTMLPDLATGFNNWLSFVGMSGAYTTSIVLGPGYSDIREQVLADQDVILLLGFYELLPTQDCQRLGGHYVTVAGVCVQLPAICVSDPFFDKNEGEPPPGSAHGSGIHNDAFFVSGPHGTIDHDRYYMAPGPPCPVTPATWMLTDYPNNWTQDGIFIFANQNSLAPMPPTQYAGGPIMVLVDAAIVICPAQQTIPDIDVIPDSLYHSQPTHSVRSYDDDFGIFNNGTAQLTYTLSNTLPWISLTGMTGSIPPGGHDLIDISVSTLLIPAGIYIDSVTILSNDPDTPVLNRPKIVINVTAICDAVPGDANGNDVFNGIDVGYSVNYLKGIGDPPPDICDCPPYLNLYAAADANGSCSFNGIDVSYSVNYLKGIGPAPVLCQWCPTGGLAVPASDRDAKESKDSE